MRWFGSNYAVSMSKRGKLKSHEIIAAQFLESDVSECSILYPVQRNNVQS